MAKFCFELESEPRRLLRFSRYRNGARTVLSNGTHGKEMIVRGNSFQNRLRTCDHKIVDLPVGVGGLAPKNLKAGAFWIFFGGPGDFRVRRDRSLQNGFAWQRRSH